MGFVNVHIKMHQEPARRTIAALNDSGPLHEFKQPDPDHFCPVSGQTCWTAALWWKRLLPATCGARIAPDEHGTEKAALRFGYCYK